MQVRLFWLQLWLAALYHHYTHLTFLWSKTAIWLILQHPNPINPNSLRFSHPSPHFHCKVMSTKSAYRAFQICHTSPHSNGERYFFQTFQCGKSQWRIHSNIPLSLKFLNSSHIQSKEVGHFHFTYSGLYFGSCFSQTDKLLEPIIITKLQH